VAAERAERAGERPLGFQIVMQGERALQGAERLLVAAEAMQRRAVIGEHGCGFRCELFRLGEGHERLLGLAEPE
jgi:hypothetical protein